MSNKTAKYLILDTEASGFHPHKHGLLEVAALALDSDLEIVATYQTDICPPPGVEFDKYTLNLTGISKDRIANGIDYAEFCETFLDFIKTNFATKPVAIAQFYPFDHAYLNHVFEYCGYGVSLNIEILSNDFIDTKSLVNVINLKARLQGQPEPFPITSLSKPGGLKDRFNIHGNGYEAHTALGDVMATREVLKHLIEYL